MKKGHISSCCVAFDFVSK